MDRVSRPLLARAGEQRVLSEIAMAAALDLSGLRPDKAEWRQFGIRAMRFAAILSLAAGMVFLVAFNWQNLGLYARFAIVEASLLAALIAAWIEGTDQLSGKLALMLAVMMTGALLALFGQTYQTGANVYELFAGWAALALPWVIACRYAPCWALWLLLVNAAVALYAGTVGHGLFFSLFMDRWRWTPWSLPFLLDVLLYAALAALSRWEGLGLSERWLRRGVMAAAMAFGTIVMAFRIFDFGERSNDSGATAIEAMLFLLASAGFGTYAYSRKEDLFGVAVLALAWIIVTATLLGHAMASAGIVMLFIVAIYVIGVSTAAVKGISYLGRTWKDGEAAQ